MRVASSWILSVAAVGSFALVSCSSAREESEPGNEGAGPGTNAAELAVPARVERGPMKADVPRSGRGRVASSRERCRAECGTRQARRS